MEYLLHRTDDEFLTPAAFESSVCLPRGVRGVVVTSSCTFMIGNVMFSIIDEMAGMQIVIEGPTLDEVWVHHIINIIGDQVRATEGSEITVARIE
jgi:hypothetical protein